MQIRYAHCAEIVCFLVQNRNQIEESVAGISSRPYLYYFTYAICIIISKSLFADAARHGLFNLHCTAGGWNSSSYCAHVEICYVVSYHVNRFVQTAMNERKVVNEKIRNLK